MIKNKWFTHFLRKHFDKLYKHALLIPSLFPGDSLTFHNGMGFTTIDHDVDEATGGNCAEWLHGGWWYNYCHRANLNGRYREIDAVDGERDQGIQWVAWKGFNYSLKKVEMKFKPFYNDY